MTEHVLFDAKIGDWVCVKKTSITPGAAKTDAARLLASIQETLSRKAFDFLREEMSFEQLEAISREIAGAEPKDPEAKNPTWVVKSRVDEQKISQALARLNSPATTRRITQALRAKTKNATEIAKTYVTLRVFDLLGFRLSLDPKTIEKYEEEKNKLNL